MVGCIYLLSNVTILVVPPSARSHATLQNWIVFPHPAVAVFLNTYVRRDALPA